MCVCVFFHVAFRMKIRGVLGKFYSLDRTDTVALFFPYLILPMFSRGKYYWLEWSVVIFLSHCIKFSSVIGLYCLKLISFPLKCQANCHQGKRPITQTISPVRMQIASSYLNPEKAFPCLWLLKVVYVLRSVILIEETLLMFNRWNSKENTQPSKPWDISDRENTDKKKSAHHMKDNQPYP